MTVMLWIVEDEVVEDIRAAPHFQRSSVAKSAAIEHITAKKTPCNMLTP
jgi:hypothetical protein